MQSIYLKQQAIILINRNNIYRKTRIAKMSFVTSTIYSRGLATRIRQGTSIKRIKMDDIELKMKNYADNMGLTVMYL